MNSISNTNKDNTMHINLKNLPCVDEMAPELLQCLYEAFVDEDDPRVLVALEMASAVKHGSVEPILHNDPSPSLYYRMDNDEVRLEVERLEQAQEDMAVLMERINKGKPMVDAAFGEYIAGKEQYHAYKARFEQYRQTDDWYFTDGVKKQTIWNRYKADQTATYNANGEKLALARKLKTHLSDLWNQWKALRDSCKGLNGFVWAEYFARQDGKSLLVDNEGLNLTNGDTTMCDDLENMYLSQTETLDWLNLEIEPEWDNN